MHGKLPLCHQLKYGKIYLLNYMSITTGKTPVNCDIVDLHISKHSVVDSCWLATQQPLLVALGSCRVTVYSSSQPCRTLKAVATSVHFEL
jgi:hypothetical protein